jgi:hypothetical protein
MPKQGKGRGKGKRPAASAKGNAKKKPKPLGNVAGGSRLLHPKHNKTAAKGQLNTYLCDPVVPELDVACKRPVNIMGSHTHFKPTGRQSKAIFHFEVRGYSEAHAFQERGANQIVPTSRPRDCTDYEPKEMVNPFGANETPWDDI